MDLNHIFSLLSTYGYALLFLAVAVEGPIVTVIAGFLVSLGVFSWWGVLIVALFGDLTGDTFLYGVGMYVRYLERFAFFRWLGITEARISKLEERFHKNAGKMLLIGKFTHTIGAASLLASGASHYSYKKFLWYNSLGTLPKSLILIIVGFYFGQAYQSIDHYLKNIGLLSALLVLGGIALYFGVKRALFLRNLKKR